MSRYNILITGGAGFIGSHLAKSLLAKGVPKVIVIDDLSHGYKENLADISSSSLTAIFESILEADLNELMDETDTIFHFAAISSLPECQSDPAKATRVNIEGTAKVLEAARMHGVRRVVFASTSAVYENNTPPFSEVLTPKPDLVYSWSKFCCELLCDSYFRNYGLDVVIARFFNVFGSSQDHRRKNPPFTSYLIRALMTGETPNLYNVIDIGRDYIYIDDLLRLVEFLGEERRFLGGEVFNIGSGQTYTPLEILRIASDLVGHDGSYIQKEPESYWAKYPKLTAGLPIDLTRLDREIHKPSICDPSKIQALSGIIPQFNMRDGLIALIESIKQEHN